MLVHSYSKILLLGLLTSISLIGCGQDRMHIVFEKSKKEVRRTEFSDKILKQMGDTTVFIFESGFDGELIKVYSNGMNMGQKKLYTDESTGLAGAWYLPPINEIESVGFSINEVRITFPLWNNYKYVFINKENDELRVQFGDAIPMYE